MDTTAEHEVHHLHDKLQAWIRADAGTGIISLNGGAARQVAVGDLVIIAAFASMTEAEADAFEPKLVYVDERNAITRTSHTLPEQPK